MKNLKLRLKRGASAAVVKIWDIKTRFDRVIDYAMNPEKTEDFFFVSSVNCQPEYAFEQMNETKKQFSKTTGILGFHAYQSFLLGETDPETAHKIGVEFAEKMWGDRFEVVVATHTNTECIHNHFCLNSVSFADGKKYYDNKSNYEKMRKISDELCRENGLSVVENPGHGSVGYAEYMHNKEENLTKDNIIRRDIDECLITSVSVKTFLRDMKKRGYTFNLDRKYPTVMNDAFKKPRRLCGLGEKYSFDAIVERIESSWGYGTIDLPQQESPVFEYLEPLVEPTYPQFYVAFITVVQAVKDRPLMNREIQRFLTEEIRKLDRLIEQQNLLCGNDIENAEQLQEYKNSCKSEIDEITKAREVMYKRKAYAKKTGDIKELREVKDDISLFNERLKILRKNIRICDRIEKQTPELEEKAEVLKAQEFERLQKKMQKQKRRNVGR